MFRKQWVLNAALATAVVGLVACGSSGNSDVIFGEGQIYLDSWTPGAECQAFDKSVVNALSEDATVARTGTTSLKIAVPATSFAGCAVKVPTAHDLRAFNAFTFWVKASKAATLNVAGFGNDNSGTSDYPVELKGIPVTTEWTKVIIPVPLATKLSAEKGLFHYGEGSEEGAYTIWIDDVQFESLPASTFGTFAPTIATETRPLEIGAPTTVSGNALTVPVTTDGGTADVTVELVGKKWMTYTSSAPSVATVDAAGVITGVATGTAVITAKLGTLDAAGAITVNVTPVATPDVAAPTPTVAEADVLSLFSDAYTADVAVDTWSASWDMADVADVQVASNATKKYSNLQFAGIEMTAAPVNATSMTHFHMDVWTPVAGTFKVKLVDFGADGAYSGGDDAASELTFDASSTPALQPSTWVSLDLPLASFTGLTTRGHIAQLIISGTVTPVFVDNVYFYAGALPAEPTTAAPAPGVAAANVVSLFSNAYTNVTVATWLASWSTATETDVQIAGDDVKAYAGLGVAGIEMTGAPVDASAMTRFHLDVWAPAAGAFNVKLVDFGADGAYGGGDDVEQELTFDAATTPAILAGSWTAIDVPLSAFTGLTTRGHIAQLVISGGLSSVWIDNVYFYTDLVTSPQGAAPTPTVAAADVISLFSNAYTNVTVDTWSAIWDNADVADVQLAGDDAKAYTNLVFAGIEFTSATIDARAMTHFHLDLWTATPITFKVKLVDFGANGAYGGGDDVEHQLTFNASSTPAIVAGGWVSLDLPLVNFTGLTTRAHLAQIVLDGGGTPVWIDNVYLYEGAPPAAPLVGPAAPTKPASKVVSLFSDSYTNVPVSTWSASWDSADVTDVALAGNNAKQYSSLVFAGIELTPLDATTLSGFHMDVWTPTAGTFKVKLVDFGADGAYGGGDDVEHELVFNDTTTPAIVGGGWVGIDVPLSDFTGLTTRAHLAQLVLTGPVTPVYVDNVYFYADTLSAPLAAAPAPTAAAADVISLFSNAYTNVTVDTWSAGWDNADVADAQVAGNDTKLYSNLGFAGIEFTSATIDATTMTHFHLDMWTAGTGTFKVKLVDFGDGGAWGGGNDVEHELVFDATTTPAIDGGAWVSFDLPLSSFTGLTTRAHLAQLVISGTMTPVWVDNVYFHK